MRSYLLWSFLTVFVLFAACNNDEDPPTKKIIPDPDPVELCDTLIAIYDGNVSAVLNTNCAISGCHRGVAPSAGVNLSNYDDAKFIATKPKFLGVINHETGFVPMPYQKAKLDQKFIDILECWVSNGMPEN